MVFAVRLTAALALALLAADAVLGATTYSYDALGRLSTVSYDNGKQVIYSYDAAGNRTQVVSQGAVNQPPTANNDAISTSVNTPVTFDPRTNDTDPEGDTLTITAKTNGTNGTVAINSGVSLTYTPAANFSGSDSFTYTISDGNGHTATATVSVTVNSGPNQPPTAANDSISTPVNTAKTFDPRTNDSDPDGDPLTITAKTNGTSGTVTINSGTSLTYTPNTNFTGSDSFTYTISDGQGHTATATVSVTVTAANQAPAAVNDSITTTKNTAKTFDPRTNDSDPDGDPLTITAKTNGAHGTVVINSGTSLTYTPTTNYTGPDSFTYTISDGQGHTATATVSVTVNSSNQPPVAVDDTVNITKFTNGTCIIPTKTFDPRSNDSDPDSDPLTITAKTNGASGTVTINSGVSMTYTYSQCVLTRTDTDSFTYTISDGQGHTDTATVTVNIDVENSSLLTSPPPDEGG